MLNMELAFAGTLELAAREAHVARAQKTGCNVAETVTKSTTFLVCGKDSGKEIEKAKKFGVRVISEEKWIKILNKTETSDNGKKRTRSDKNSENRYQRKLVYLESRQYKRYWQMRRVYKTTYIRTGSIGTRGMETSKEYETKKLAKDNMNSMIETKKASGYREANRPQALDYEDSSDSSDDNLDDKNGDAQVLDLPKHQQKKQRLENEENKDNSQSQSDTNAEMSDAPLKNLLDDGPLTCQKDKVKKDEKVDPIKSALKVEVDEMNEDLSTAKSLPPLPSYVTNPKKLMSIRSVDVLLAYSWESDEVNPTGWWISEKLDGVRAFWNSKSGKFFSRSGNEFVAPSWFTKGLPRNRDLDGELFGGRGKFQSTISIVKAGEEEWKNIRYEIFDVPTLGQIPFEERMDYLKKMMAEDRPKYARLVKQRLAKSERDVYDELERVEKIGAEGLMLRKPGSLYEKGRSKTLLKVKTFHDGEAVVIAHEPGKGKYVRLCGSLRCRMASGKEFKVGSGMNDYDRANPPPIGSIIIYRCQELSNSGSPRFPTYLGVALDKDKPNDPNFGQKVKVK